MTKPKLTAIEIEYRGKRYRHVLRNGIWFGCLSMAYGFDVTESVEPPLAVLNLAAKIDKALKVKVKK
jgi:hypothetical protein